MKLKFKKSRGKHENSETKSIIQPNNDAWIITLLFILQPTMI